MGRTVGLLWRSAISCQLRLSWLRAHKVNCHKDADFSSFCASASLSVWFLSARLSLCHLFSLSLCQCYSRRYSTQGYLAQADSWLHGKGMRLVFLCVRVCVYVCVVALCNRVLARQKGNYATEKERCLIKKRKGCHFVLKSDGGIRPRGHI